MTGLSCYFKGEITMSKIIFINAPESIYDCKFLQIGEHQIRLEFDSNIPEPSIYLSGCYLVNEWNSSLIQTHREDYKYLYRTYDEHPNIIELCNDNIPYNEPDDVIPPIDPYVPTLDEVKSSKISELSKTCNSLITTGIDVEIDGVTEHFSYNDEDQTNIKELFDIVIQTNSPMYYHQDNGSCKLYSAEQIINLYITEVTNKMHHTTYFNQLKMYIKSLNDADDVSAIVYGDKLQGVYLETYNNAMLQAKENVELLLQNRRTVI